MPWTKDNARKALQWERRLELAMENPRFFDLVRWGIAAETLNAYISVEKTKRDYLKETLHDVSNKKLSLTTVGGDSRVVNLEVYRLESIWLKREQELRYKR